MMSRYTIHVSVISGYPISIDFRKLTGCRRDPGFWGVTSQLLLINLIDHVVSHVLPYLDNTIFGVNIL